MTRNMVILLDANVILDYIVSREPYYQQVYQIMKMCLSGEVKGYMAFHSVSIIWYTLRKFIPDQAIRRSWMRKILRIIRVTGAGHEEVVKAVDMENFKDFEDCLQDRCAEGVSAEYIVTNNVKDFSEAIIKAVSPSDFCRIMLGEGYDG